MIVLRRMTSCETITLSLFVVLVSLTRLRQKREVSKLIMWLARTEDDDQCLWLWLAKCSICKHLISSSLRLFWSFSCASSCDRVFVFTIVSSSLKRLPITGCYRSLLSKASIFHLHCSAFGLQARPRNLSSVNQAGFQPQTELFPAVDCEPWPLSRVDGEAML